MSLFNRALGAAFLAVALVAPLAACTGIRPVYSDAGLGAKRVEVAYSIANNRLEQIIYQDLALRLGKAPEGDVPMVTVSARSGSVNLANNSASPASPGTPRQATVTATLTVKAPDGTVLFTGSRSQTADYQNDPQALANQQATISAERQAALLLADTLRLQILAALSKWSP